MLFPVLDMHRKFVCGVVTASEFQGERKTNFKRDRPYFITKITFVPPTYQATHKQDPAANNTLCECILAFVYGMKVCITTEGHLTLA